MARPEAVMELAKRRGFLWPSNEVYGGLAGFYDYGPLGAVMKNRLEALWRHVFHNAAVPMAEVACPRVTPHEVLKASGHVDEFTDLVVKCPQGHPQRADHLIEAAGFEGVADTLSAAAVDEEVLRLRPKCPVCGQQKWDPAAPMNLMFQTEIGPGSGRVGYLRPETAQGIFTDFPHLLRHFRGRLPFGGTQVGGAHRNEISPRQGMVRLREFHMMEAEVFFERTQAPFPAFQEVAERRASFVPAGKEAVELSFGEAVASGTVAHEALGYFLALTHDFLVRAGMDPQRLRLRQHLADEMAHYASDCWDAEFHSERFGWVECVGVADRGCYDLTQHAQATGRWGDFTIPVELPEPVEVRHLQPVVAAIGKRYRKDAKQVIRAIEDANLAAAGQAGLEPDFEPENGTLDDVTGRKETVGPAEPGPDWPEHDGDPLPEECVRATVRRYLEKRVVPRVVEPSFGVDRILYALWEHAYETTEKEGEPYVRLRLAHQVAPVQVAVLPLMAKGAQAEKAVEIGAGLRRAGIHTDLDTSGNIGRRYARQDEVGTPYCVTVDEQSLEDATVTLRDRDTTEQERLPIAGLLETLQGRLALG